MKKCFLIGLFVLALAAGMACALLPPLPASAEEVEFSFPGGNSYEIRDGKYGNVEVLRYANNGESTVLGPYNPRVTEFVFKDSGNFLCESLELKATVDITVKLKNIDIGGGDFTFKGTGGNVRLILEGKNVLRWGKQISLTIPPGKTYTVTGSGSMEIGNVESPHDIATSSPAGTLRVESGTVNLWSEGSCQANVILAGGWFDGVMAPGATIIDAEGNALYPLIMDFTDPSCDPYINIDDKKLYAYIVVNGRLSPINARSRKGLIYLRAGTKSITMSAASGGAAITLPIPDVTSAGAELKVSVQKQVARINLKNGPVTLTNPANLPHAVRCIQGFEGQEQTITDYDVFSTPSFEFTTDGEEVEGWIHYNTDRISEVTLDNCKLKVNSEGVSAFHSDLCSNLILNLVGENQLWAPDTGCGLQLYWSHNCTVRGEGFLSLKGGRSAGDHSDHPGTVCMESGTIQVEGDSLFNAALRYTGGFINGKGPDEDSFQYITRVPLDFSDATFKDCLPENNQLIISGYKAYLDENKSTCIYLGRGISAIRLSGLKIGEDFDYPVTLTPDGSKYEPVKVKLASVEPPETTSFTALLKGNWFGAYQNQNRKFIYERTSGVGGALPAITMSNLDESTHLLKNLTPDTEYRYRADGLSGDNTMIASEWVTFRTKKACTLTLDGGAVTAGTPVMGKTFDYNTEIRLTADTPPEGHLFYGWYDGDERLTQTRDYSFVIDRSRELRARTIAMTDLIEGAAEEMQITTSAPSFDWYANPDVKEIVSDDLKHTYAPRELELHFTAPEGGLKLSFDWWIGWSSHGYGHIAELYHNGEKIESEQILLDTDVKIHEKELFLPEGENSIHWLFTANNFPPLSAANLHIKDLRLAVPEPVTITAQPNNPDLGSVTPTVQTGVQAKAVMVEALPNPGYYLSAWVDEAGNVVSRDRKGILYPSASETYTAVFAPAPDYSRAVQEGKISLYPHYGTSGALWTPKEDNSLQSGVITDFSVLEPKESVFVGEFTVPEDGEKFLEFECMMLPLYLDKVYLEIDGVKQDLYTSNEWRTMRRTFGEGDHTVKWIHHNATGAKEPSLWVRNIRLYDIPYYTVTAEPDNGAYGSAAVDPDLPSYPRFQRARIKAQPASGYYLNHWLLNGVPIHMRGNSFPIDVLENMAYTAVFGNIAEDFKSLIDENSQNAVTFTQTGNQSCSWLPAGDGTAFTCGGDSFDTYDLTASVIVPEGEAQRFSFVWKVSSETDEYLRFFINGEEQEAISGVGAGWQNYSVMLDPGEYTVAWEYKAPVNGNLNGETNGGYLRGLSLRAAGDGTGIVTAASSDPALGTAAVTMKDGGPIENPVAGGGEVTFTAQPKPENFGVFLYWTDKNGVIVSDKPTFTAAVDGDLAYTAQFSTEQVYYDSETNTAVVLLSGELPAAALAFAAYDADGVLVSHSVSDGQSLPEGRTVYSMDEEITPVKGGTVKVFLWEDLNSLKPVPLNQNRAE